MFKRIFLFLVINLLVVFTISVVLNILNVRPYLQAHGLDIPSLMIFCLVWGMGGAFISLALSRTMAKWMMGVQILDPNTRDPEQQRLIQTVYTLGLAAKLDVMPQVGIFPSYEVNAFATGPTKKRALVAVSSGLLQKMRQEEIEGVIAHELTHITNGDMVTMTLLQGIVNAFVMFLARILAYVVSGLGQRREQDSRSISTSYIMLVYLFEILFMALGWILLAWFSRGKEFRADAGGARLAGKEKMIAALEMLQRQTQADPRIEKPAYAAFKISSPRKKSAFIRLFATHPPLEERIQKLRSY